MPEGSTVGSLASATSTDATSHFTFMERSNLHDQRVSAVPRLQWNNDPQLFGTSGRSAVALPLLERRAARSHPSIIRSRSQLLSDLTDHFQQESSGWDSQAESL